jgi:hypothetical protein
MGLEADCTVTFGGERGAGTALLETAELLFRGPFRLKIPFTSIRLAEAKRGVLTVEFDAGVAAFDLGKAAGTWALKIRYPKPLIDKVGVKPGMRVLVAGRVDETGAETFWRDVRARAVVVTRGASADLVLLVVETLKDLDRLAAARKAIKMDGAIWVLYPKGVKTVREGDVRAAAARHDLVDVKIAGVSDRQSSVKLVIPVKKRSKGAA